MGFFDKLGEQVQEEMMDNLILFYYRYIFNNGESVDEVLELAELLNAYDRQDVYSNLPSEVAREALAYASNVYLNTLNSGYDISSIKRAKELLEELKLIRDNYEKKK